jgi:hypothetical protein
MATHYPTHPTRTPTWATDAAAEVTDPGVSKVSTGFVVGEAPAASHLNWQLKQQGDWIDFLYTAFAHPMAAARLRAVDNNPFDTFTSGTKYMMVYDTLASYWYCTVSVGAAAACRAYSSSDGQTWGTGVLLDSSLSGSYNGSRGASNGTKVIFGHDQYAKVFSSNVVTGTPTTNTFNSITNCRDLIYSSTLGKWLACGHNGVNGFIESSADGATWAVEQTWTSDFANQFAVATSGNYAGRIIVTNTVSDDILISDDGGDTWSEDTATTGGLPFSCLHWSPSLGRWIGIQDTATNDLYISSDHLGNNYSAAGLNISGPLIITDRAVFYIHNNTFYQLIYTNTSAEDISSVAVWMGAQFVPVFTTNNSKMSIIRGSEGAFTYIRQDGDAMFSDFAPNS